MKPEFFSLLALADNSIPDDSELCIDVITFNVPIDSSKGCFSSIILIALGIIGFKRAKSADKKAYSSR